MGPPASNSRFSCGPACARSYGLRAASFCVAASRRERPRATASCPIGAGPFHPAVPARPDPVVSFGGPYAA
eukprot:7371555-Lingulodinium_polyedra.AAC.1